MEVGADEIKNDIHMSRLRWFGHVMWMTEERMPKEMLHTNGAQQLRGKSITRWIDQIRKDIEMRGENWEEVRE